LHAERQRRHRAKMAARAKLVTRTRIDPPDPVGVDPVLARYAMTGAEVAKLFGGIPVMSNADLAALQAMPGGSDPADFPGPRTMIPTSDS
jgi:hypothetical protein